MPHVTCVTLDGRTGHLPALEPHFTAQCTGQQFAPHVPPPQGCSPLGAGTSSSALLPERPLGGNDSRESWQQQWQGLQLAQLAPLAATVVPELPTLTQPLTHCSLSPLPSPSNGTAGSCGVPISPYHLLMYLGIWEAGMTYYICRMGLHPEPRPPHHSTTQNSNNPSGWQTEEPKGSSPDQCPAELKALVSTLWV